MYLQILKDDSKPKGICDHCFKKVDQFSDFVDLCIETNQRFDSILFNKSCWPEVKNVNIPEYVPQKSVIVNLKNETESYTSEPDGVLPLDNINITLKESVLQIVENATNLQANLNNFMNSTSKHVTNYPECNDTVLRHSSHVSNITTHSNFYFNNTNYEFVNEGNETMKVENNYTQYFADQKKLEVVECFRETVNPEDSDKKDGCTRTDNLKNPNFNKNLISFDSVRNNLSISDGISIKKIKISNKYTCSYCSKVFMRRLSLNSHVVTHTKNLPFTCSKCGKLFAIKSELTIHKKIHTEQYQCKICLKSFVVPSKLARHIRIHTNEKPFKCDFEKCQKSFRDQSNLFEHKETHKNVRNLKCESCEKFFKTKNQLKSHKLSHNSDILYTCDICKQSYKYKTNLIFHMKKHTGYTCPYCNLNCGRLSSLVRHRKECNRSKIK